MFFYKVRHHLDSQEYPCGPELEAEGAIMHFNATYGSEVGRKFTPLGTGTPRGDYDLIEQQRRGDVGLHDVSRIPLYEKL
jgi:hypothetical protein